MRLDRSEGANLLNIQYGVCFGVIFSLCFYLNSTPPKFNITLTIPWDNPIPFAGLVFYFFLDWIHANWLKEKIQFNLWLVLLWSIAIWCLGSVVTMTNSSNVSKYLLIGSYVSVVGIYHLISYLKKLYPLPSGSLMIGVFSSSIIALIGIYFLFNALLLFFQIVKTNSHLEAILSEIVVCLVVVKIFHICNLHGNLGGNQT